MKMHFKEIPNGLIVFLKQWTFYFAGYEQKWCEIS